MVWLGVASAVAMASPGAAQSRVSVSPAATPLPAGLFPVAPSTVVHPAHEAPDSVGPAHRRLLPDGDPRASSADDLALLAAGVSAAAVGSLAGAFAGYRLDRAYFHWDCRNGCEDPGLIGLLGGWVVGSAVTTPIGVHLVGGRRGSLGLAYASSAVIGGTALALTFGGAAELAFLAAPLLQVISAVTIERAGTR